MQVLNHTQYKINTYDCIIIVLVLNNTVIYVQYNYEIASIYKRLTWINNSTQHKVIKFLLIVGFRWKVIT